MLIIENITINGKDFIKTYSDKGMMIERDGAQYSEAVDPAELNRLYIETEEPIKPPYMTETEEKAQAYDILTGESE